MLSCSRQCVFCYRTTNPLVQRTVKPFKKALPSAGGKSYDVNEVILVDGRVYACGRESQDDTARCALHPTHTLVFVTLGSKRFHSDRFHNQMGMSFDRTTEGLDSEAAYSSGLYRSQSVEFNTFSKVFCSSGGNGTRQTPFAPRLATAGAGRTTSTLVRHFHHKQGTQLHGLDPSVFASALPNPCDTFTPAESLRPLSKKSAVTMAAAPTSLCCRLLLSSSKRLSLHRIQTPLLSFVRAYLVVEQLRASFKVNSHIS